jgi:hypothetical protein
VKSGVPGPVHHAVAQRNGDVDPVAHKSMLRGRYPSQLPSRARKEADDVPEHRIVI